MSLLEDGALVASYYTLTGAHLSRPPRHSLASRVRAAAAAGFTGLALAPAELPDDGDPRPLVAVVADAGLTVPELEPLRGWDSDDRTQEPAMFALADAFGSRQITTIRLVGDEVSDGLLAERFAGLAARAAEHGVTIGLEPRAHSPMSTPGQAAALLEASGAANAGIVLDAYHVHRAGVELDEIAAVAGRIASIQLNDMHAEPRGTPAEDALEHRLVPGEGDIDLAGWLAGLESRGVSAPLAVEVLSREHNERTLDDAARRAADGGRTALAAARRLTTSAGG
jgi:sugar phosphate isomerase/epimerase